MAAIPAAANAPRAPAVPSPLRLAGLCALILAAGPAAAADFDQPYPPAGSGDRRPAYEPGPERLPPPEPELRRPRFTAAPPEACREFVRRRLDPDGEPVLRRVRVCEEPDLGRGPPPPPEEIPPRRWGGHWGGPRW
jgi:hypothetical protein